MNIQWQSIQGEYGKQSLATGQTSLSPTPGFNRIETIPNPTPGSSWCWHCSWVPCHRLVSMGLCKNVLHWAPLPLRLDLPNGQNGRIAGPPKTQTGVFPSHSEHAIDWIWITLWTRTSSWLIEDGYTNYWMTYPATMQPFWVAAIQSSNFFESDQLWFRRNKIAYWFKRFDWSCIHVETFTLLPL